MKVQDICEGLSPVLFHATMPDVALKILDGNVFKLSSSLAKPTERGMSNKHFYMSTTRSRAGSYHYSQGSSQPLGRIAVIFKLDGRKLSSVAGGGAVDYWGADFRKLDPKNNEMEDRLISDKPEIENADKYILSVELFLGADNRPDDVSHRSLTTLRDIATLCVQRGIALNLYTKHTDFVTGKRAVSGEAALERLSVHGPNEPVRPERDYSDLTPYIEMMRVADRSELSDKARKELDNLRYDRGNGRLKADFHNSNRHDDSRVLTALAKKHRINDLDGLAEFIRAKFK